MYCFKMRHLCESKLHADYSIPLRFYLEWSALSGRCQKIVSGLIIMGIWQMGRLLSWGLGVVPAILYHCNAVSALQFTNQNLPKEKQHGRKVKTILVASGTFCYYNISSIIENQHIMYIITKIY